VRGVLPWCAQFSNAVLHQEGGFREIVASGMWDLRAEVKRRVWHAFWAGVLTTGLGEDATAAAGTPIADRFRRILRGASDMGKHRILAHFHSLVEDSTRDVLRQWVQAELEGVDVYWDGPVHGGNLRSATKFGKVSGARVCGAKGGAGTVVFSRLGHGGLGLATPCRGAVPPLRTARWCDPWAQMYVVPYPFHCVVVYDDSSDYAFIHDDALETLRAKSMEPECARRRDVRQRLRSLHGQRVYFPFTQTEVRSVEDTYRNSEGKEEERMVLVPVVMSYTYGVVAVVGNTSNEMAAGFKVSAYFADGTGVAVAPNTGERIELTGSTTLSAARLGITPTYEMTDELTRLLEQGGNDKVVATNMPRYLDSCRAYRARLMAERAADESTLSSAFWLHVYDAETLPRAAAELYLTSCETNPVVRRIPVDHRAGLDFLYARLAFVRQRPSNALW
jgi:hypothetical protein